MTRKEAIRRVEFCRNFLADNYSDMGEPNFMALNMAIKALEQESILDKISSEIMQLYNEVEVVDYDHNDVFRIKKAHWITREEVLWIIDKYKKAVRIDDKNIDNKL